MDEHTLLPDVLLISTHTWNKLTNQEKDWITLAVELSVIEQRKLWSKSEKESLDAVQRAGVEIIIPDKKLFSEKSKSVLESYKSNEEIYSFIDRIRKTE